MNNNLSFRDFLEYQKQKIDYLNQIEDELGIPPELVADSPQTISQFSIGGNSYNLSGYKILGYDRDSDGNITHAKIQMMNDTSDTTKKKFKKDDDGKQIRVSAYEDPDNKVYTIPVEQLNTALLQGLDSQSPM